jgi:hypothetical protein
MCMTSIPISTTTSKTYPVEHGVAGHHMLSLFRHNATLVIKRHISLHSPTEDRKSFQVDPSASFRSRSKRYQGAWLSFTILRTAFSYATLSFLKRLYASAWAGESGLTSSSSIWIPRRICLMVMAGFQASSSLRIERQTVPEG